MSQENGLTPIQKLILSFSIILFLAIGGSIGFSILEGMSIFEGLYMTVITLSMVGFGEVRPLHPAGRAFVIMLIIFGVASGTFALSALRPFTFRASSERTASVRKT